QLRSPEVTRENFYLSESTAWVGVGGGGVVCWGVGGCVVGGGVCVCGCVCVCVDHSLSLCLSYTHTNPQSPITPNNDFLFGFPRSNRGKSDDVYCYLTSEKPSYLSGY